MKEINALKAQERAGTLSREQAQALTVELLSAMRDGPSTYIWVRTTGALGLVHPKAEVIGKVDFGKVLAKGKTNFQTYLDELSGKAVGLFDDMAARPGGSGEPVAKIDGVTLVHDWNWVIG